jgi:TRAP-type C4-dicarboxylate transport system permease small subunit
VFRNLDKILMTFFLVNVVLVIVLQILARTVGAAFSWTQEYACFSYVWSIFLGVALVYRNDAHIKISFLVDWLPRGVQRVVDGIGELLVLLCLSVVFIPSVGNAVKGLRASSPSMQIPMFWIDVSIPVCLAMLIVQSAKRLAAWTRPDRGA